MSGLQEGEPGRARYIQGSYAKRSASSLAFVSQTEMHWPPAPLPPNRFGDALSASQFWAMGLMARIQF